MKTILGLTGGYCSGKNQAGRTIEALGWDLIDVDRLGHEALAVCAHRLAETFGPGILRNDGGIDRKALGAILFSDPARMKTHEAIVHPVMLSLLDKRIEASARPCINAALLYRFPQCARCSLVLEVRSPLLARIRRGMQRDGLKALQVVKRIWSQRHLWKLRPADSPEVIIIRNSGSEADLDARVRQALSSRRASFPST
jgi:dephospho-CoA kinase